MTKKFKIVMLCGKSSSTGIVYNFLAAHYGRFSVIQEEPVPRIRLLKRRGQRLGWVKAVGQLLFVALIVPVLKRKSSFRQKEILDSINLSSTKLPDEYLISVPSVNSEQAIQKLREIDPDIVVVNGTRIIGEDTLKSVNASFINMHAGITPAYRGAHGGYWALYENKPQLVGTTIHQVDTGIDTGQILYQVTFTPTTDDNFATYPLLHIREGLPYLLQAIEDVRNNKLVERLPLTNSEQSSLKYHPTIWQYLGSDVN